MEYLKIEKINKEADFNPDKIHEDCFIDVKEDMGKPPIAISMGYKYNDYVPIVTYGNFCAIGGVGKSMKTFLKSALLACYIGGKSQNYFPEIIGHETKGKYVIDIDTEQSKYHAQKAARRVLRMVGTMYDDYVCFGLRPKTAKERLEFIDWIVTKSQYSGKIGVLSIDGVADLMETDVNNLEEANEVTQKLMTWSEEYNIAILTVIHKNFGDGKITGHLGSAITKKAESVIYVSREKDIVAVSNKYSRNIAFDDFSFSVDQTGIPYQVDGEKTF